MPELWIPVDRIASDEKTSKWEARSDRMNQPKEMETNPCMGVCSGYGGSPGQSLRAIGAVDQKLRTFEWRLKL